MLSVAGCAVATTESTKQREGGEEDPHLIFYLGAIAVHELTGLKDTKDVKDKGGLLLILIARMLSDFCC